MFHISSTGLRVLAALLIVLTVGANSPAAAAPALPATPTSSPGQPDLGPNVRIFDPSMPTSEIQAVVDSIASQQVDNEMGTERYTLLFKPGTYGSVDNPLIIQVGYYTEVAGLGIAPTDVIINGHVDVYNRCETILGCIALTNFWRSVSNLTIRVMGLTGCRATANFWAVSQAAPMRRVNITGGVLTLTDYCTAGPQYASGGFIADSRTGVVLNGLQQQFLVRDSRIGGWSNGVWNQVFSGVVGAPPQSFSAPQSSTPPYTTLATSPVTREKPFLYVDSSDNFQVFVPTLRRDAVGTAWSTGASVGLSVPIDRFFIATPNSDTQSINNALLQGQNVIFTPGVYHLTDTLQVKRADTVVLGLGFPTLVPSDGTTAMKVADIKGVKLAGLLFDASPVNSPVLLQVGPPRSTKSDPANPTSLQDIFFRIGGATPGRATTSLIVNSNNVLLDNIWAWRADHGNDVGWTSNTADTGVVINGSNVTAYGMFVEHFQKYQLVWNGENGRTIFFQSEMPYDPPNQAAWTHDGVNGYAAYKVADSVRTHEAWGMGTYCFFIVNPSIHAARGFEVPDRPGVKLHDILTVPLGGLGTIDHVVNNTGDSTQGLFNTPVNLLSYP